MQGQTDLGNYTCIYPCAIQCKSYSLAGTDSWGQNHLLCTLKSPLALYKRIAIVKEGSLTLCLSYKALCEPEPYRSFELQM